MSRCKYYKQIEQVSYDGGETWEYVDPAQYQKGELYQEDSDDCLYGRWTLVPGGYICEDNNKYQKKVFEVSDDGINYRIKYPAEYTKGDLIEENSIECTFKWYGRYNLVQQTPAKRYIIDPIKTILCYGNDDLLTSGDTRYEGYALYSGYVGTCVTRIGGQAFEGCGSLSSITISDSVTTIGNNAFDGCTSLSSCTIPSGVTYLGNQAFEGCSGLTDINIPSGVTYIGSYAFENCSGLTNITIPDRVTSISEGTFSACTSLSSCTIGNGVTSIGVGAFNGCWGLSNIVIPDSVTTIRTDAFYGTSLTSCTIGSGITTIGSNVFYGCYRLESITIYATTPPSLNGYLFDTSHDCTIYVPSGSVSAYQSASMWSRYRIRAIPT